MPQQRLAQNDATEKTKQAVSECRMKDRRREYGACCSLQTDVSKAYEALGEGLISNMQAARKEVHSERRRPAGGRRDRC